MIAVVGAGAMGAAMAVVHARAGEKTALLGTRFDEAAIDACSSGKPHPALGVELSADIRCLRHETWADELARAERIVLAVSSDGLAGVVEEVSALVRPPAVWTVATKGWDAETLRTPAEVIGSVVDAERVVVLAGPALAPELVAGAPTAMVCASESAAAAEEVASVLRSAGIVAQVTDDVAGVEVGAAYKNVTAIAVGMCEGLSERLPERVYVHGFADARAAMFALGLRDMSRLAVPQGGRLETILGLAGAGDLYVTCLGGRNGGFGRSLGAGQTPERAREAIGSTVEGIANTGAALSLAERLGVELDVARAVDRVLAGSASPRSSIEEALRSVGAS